MFVYMFYVCEMIGFVEWLDKRFMCEECFETCICLWPKFDCSEVTLFGWLDIKIKNIILEYNFLSKTLNGQNILWMYKMFYRS